MVCEGRSNEGSGTLFRAGNAYSVWVPSLGRASTAMACKQDALALERGLAPGAGTDRHAMKAVRVVHLPRGRHPRRYPQSYR